MLGQVVTFYSYKGGVGRSMALANAAVLLAISGRRVLIVDWDLEARGLERYFADTFEGGHAPARHVPGVLELAESARDRSSLDWRDCVIRARPLPPSGEPVSIITAGRDDTTYVPRLQALDWEALFSQHGFGMALESIRTEWRKDFDFVLIDSRTGITDIGGICTILLPDVLVCMFTSNTQSVEGVKAVVDRAREARRALPFDRSYLIAIPVPARDESRTEYQKALEWRRRYATEFAALYRDFTPKPFTASDVVEILRIPYIPYWSFGESLTVLEEGTTDPSSISAAYKVLAEVLDSNIALVLEDLSATGDRERDRYQREKMLQRLSTSMSLGLQDATIDTDLRYLRIQRRDAVDMRLGSMRSTRRLHVCNVGSVSVTSLRHTEFGENKITHADLQLSGRCVRTGASLEFRALNDPSMSFSRAFEMILPDQLDPGMEVEIEYELSWANEYRYYGQQPHSQSISLIPYRRGVERLEFSVAVRTMPEASMTRAWVAGLDDGYREHEIGEEVVVHADSDFYRIDFDVDLPEDRLYILYYVLGPSSEPGPVAPHQR